MLVPNILTTHHSTHYLADTHEHKRHEIAHALGIEPNEFDFVLKEVPSHTFQTLYAEDLAKLEQIITTLDIHEKPGSAIKLRAVLDELKAKYESKLPLVNGRGIKLLQPLGNIVKEIAEHEQARIKIHEVHANGGEEDSITYLRSIFDQINSIVFHSRNQQLPNMNYEDERKAVDKTIARFYVLSQVV